MKLGIVLADDRPILRLDAELPVITELTGPRDVIHAEFPHAFTGPRQDGMTRPGVGKRGSVIGRWECDSWASGEAPDHSAVSSVPAES